MGSVSTSDVTISNTPDGVGPKSVLPKLEPDQDGYDSPSASSLDQDNESEAALDKLPTDPPPIPKRKGGRKPVSLIPSLADLTLTLFRSTPPRKNESNEIDKHKRPSENGGPSISSS